MSFKTALDLITKLFFPLFKYCSKKEKCVSLFRFSAFIDTWVILDQKNM
jgi:hypothetical protein